MPRLALALLECSGASGKGAFLAADCDYAAVPSVVGDSEKSPLRIIVTAAIDREGELIDQLRASGVPFLALGRVTNDGLVRFDVTSKVVDLGWIASDFKGAVAHVTA